MAVEELVGKPFVMREVGSGTRRIAELVLQNPGISTADLTIVLETNSNEAIRGAVWQGSDFGFLPKAAAANDRADGRLVVLNVAGIHARMSSYLVTDPDRMFSPAVRAFLSFVDRSEATTAAP